MAKICAYCNSPIEDEGVKFCPNCGASLAAPEKEPAAPEVAANADVADTAPVMPPMDTISETPKKKKSGFKKFLFIAIPVILIAAILFNMSSISGLITKLFGSDESYFKYVEEQSVADTADTFSNIYQDYLLDDVLEDNSYNVTFSLKLSDDLKNTIKGDYAEGLDIDWLDDTTFNATLDLSGKKVADELLIGIGGQHVLTTSAFFDLENNKMLLKLKEITDDVMVFDLSSSDADDGDIFSMLTGENRELAAAVLPKASVAKSIFTKYHGIIVDKIENVEKSKETVTVGDISEELTVLKATISEKTLKEIALAVLNELKDDKDIKSIIENAESALKGDGKTYSQFVSGIEEAIKEAEKEEASDDTVLVILDYVDSSDKLVGRKIGENGEALDYVTVKNGNKFASRCSFEGSAEITGAGTLNGDRETSEYTLSEDGKTLYKIVLTDFDSEAFKDGVIDGKIRLVPNSDAIKNAAPSKYKSFAGMLDFAAEIEGKGDAKSGEFKVVSLNGEKPLFTADAKYTVSSAKSVSEPSGKKVEIKDLDSLEALMGDLHLDELVANLRKTTVPKDYVDAIDEIAKQLK